MRITGTNINMVRGDSESITVSLQKDNEVVPFNQGDTVYFTVKQSSSTEEKILQKVITEFDEGKCIIEITPADTKELAFKIYVYDIQLTDANGVITTIIPCSKFTISEEVTYE